MLNATLQLPGYHSSLSIKAVIEKLESNETTGLTNEEAALRIKQFGNNSIEAKKRKHLFFELLSHFKNPLILILIVATIISYSLGETINASIILFMILISVAIDFYQEQDARNAAERLKQSVKSKAVVIRNGKQEEIFHSVNPNQYYYDGGGWYVCPTTCRGDATKAPRVVWCIFFANIY